MSPEQREELAAYGRELAQLEPPITDTVAVRAAHILVQATTPTQEEVA